MTGDIVVDGLPYPVIVAADAALTLPPLVAPEARSAVVVYDKKVSARAQAIGAALRDAGIDVREPIAVPGGERTKRAGTVASLYDGLLDRSADRRTLLVAIGGGTVTDLAGFVAATFMRGIPWAVVPTTVLGMADAAIGGKTGIDLPQGKNLVGAFWDPRAVVADCAALATLPARERSTGLAEAIKCAVIAGGPMLDSIGALTSHAKPAQWRELIAATANVKAQVVGADPLEGGRRAVLNLGHTVGHALELASAYRMSHGQAVSIGLRAAGLIARSRGWWPASDHVRTLNVLRAAGLPVYAAGLKTDAVMKGLARDKKMLDGRLRFVLPATIGDVRHGIEVETPVVRDAVEACLTPPTPAELA